MLGKQPNREIEKAVGYMQLQLKREVWVGGRERSGSHWCIGGRLMLGAQVRLLVKGVRVRREEGLRLSFEEL